MGQENDMTSQSVKVQGDIREITPQALLNLGLDQIVYIKPMSVDGEQAYAVQSADGSTLSMEASLDEAVVTARANDMHTVLLQ
jgi:hypothetical protein